MKDGEAWRTTKRGSHHCKVPMTDKRLALLRAAHNQMGHRGIFSTYTHLKDRFWWPQMGEDVKWFVRTCHECQLQQMRHFISPPVVVVVGGGMWLWGAMSGR